MHGPPPGSRSARTAVRFVGDPSRARIGRGTSIHGPTVVYVSGGGGCEDHRLEIGSTCLISQFVTVVGTNHREALERGAVGSAEDVVPRVDASRVEKRPE